MGAVRGVGGEAVGPAVLAGLIPGLVGAAALHGPAAVQVHRCLRLAQVRHLRLAALARPLLRRGAGEARLLVELLVVLHGDGGGEAVWVDQSGSVVQAVGLVGGGAGRRGKQLAQCPKYLRTGSMMRSRLG